MKIALLGGSFNPPHIGHAMLAETMLEEFHCNKVLIVPTNIPPHKVLSNAASAKDRLGMVRAMCEGNSAFEACGIEVERGGVSYTVDTLESINAMYRGKLDCKVLFVMGQEIAAEFYKWKDAARIADIADLVIARRHPDRNGIDTKGFENPNKGDYVGGFVPDDIDTSFRYPHTMLDNPMLPLSSTEIRARIAGGKAWRYLVCDGVYRYIKEHGLYSVQRGENERG